MAKTKKMTQKEFKEVFESAGFIFDIWGWEGILNMIAMSERTMAENSRNNGSIYTAKSCEESAEIIFKALEARGYYKN